MIEVSGGGAATPVAFATITDVEAARMRQCAQPGAMTVNGTVTLCAMSLSLFEVTPTMSDRLMVNGALWLAQGATLQVVAAQPCCLARPSI